MTAFYQENSLYRTENAPLNISESLPASDNLYCCKGNVTIATGESIAFYWWEWYLKSNTAINGVPTPSFDHHLAISFAPNTVSEEFAQKVIHQADKSGNYIWQMVKDLFVLNAQTPYRAGKLADGSLVIYWPVLKKSDVYDSIIAWLKDNITVSLVSINTMAEKTDAGALISTANLEIRPSEKQTDQIVFYKNENYKTLRQKFNANWAIFAFGDSP